VRVNPSSYQIISSLSTSYALWDRHELLSPYVVRIYTFIRTNNLILQVKGGGHATSPKISSTPGVQISMSRFSSVTFNPDTQTAIVGSGLIWDDVYSALEPFNVSVLGGRVTGIGVAGFMLGGGKNTSIL